LLAVVAIKMARPFYDAVDVVAVENQVIFVTIFSFRSVFVAAVAACQSVLICQGYALLSSADGMYPVPTNPYENHTTSVGRRGYLLSEHLSAFSRGWR
jgi:hypothetical protein